MWTSPIALLEGTVPSLHTHTVTLNPHFIVERGLKKIIFSLQFLDLFIYFGPDCADSSSNRPAPVQRCTDFFSPEVSQCSKSSAPLPSFPSPPPQLTHGVGVRPAGPTAGQAADQQTPCCETVLPGCSRCSC